MKAAKKRRDLLIRLGLAVASVVVSFLIIEMVLRVGFKDRVPLFPRYHTDAVYGDFLIRRIRPNAVFWHTSVDGSWKFTTNAQGFRNYSDFDYAKPEGVIRIVSLGDSNTQGVEVRQEYTFSAIIEKYLRQQGNSAEVINTGVSGFGTAEELVLLENEMVKYHPDVVILGFSKTDFLDNVRSDLFELDQQQSLVLKNTEYIPGVKIQNMIYTLPLIDWLSQNSLAYSLGFNSVWQYYKEASKGGAAEMSAEYAVPLEGNASDLQVLLASKLIERMHRFCQDNRIKFIIVDIPNVINDTESQQYSPGIPPSLLQSAVINSDAVITSDAVLSEFRGLTDLFVHHGQRHISEFTHTLLGVAISKQIEALLR